MWLATFFSAMKNIYLAFVMPARAGEVLVRIHHAAAIPLDWKIRIGWLQEVVWFH